MKPTILSDTSASEQERQLVRIGALSDADRLGRALALSALAREFTWAGARQVSGKHGLEAVRQRFLEQTYDRAYLHRWAAELEVDDLLDRFLEPETPS